MPLMKPRNRMSRKLLSVNAKPTNPFSELSRNVFSRWSVSMVLLWTRGYPSNTLYPSTLNRTDSVTISMEYDYINQTVS